MASCTMEPLTPGMMAVAEAITPVKKIKKLLPNVSVRIGSALVFSPVNILSKIKNPALNIKGMMSFQVNIFVLP